MNNDDLFIKKYVFNKQILSPGTVVHLEGLSYDGEDLTGNYLIKRNAMLELHLIGGKGSAPKSIRIDIEDIESGLELEVVARNE